MGELLQDTNVWVLLSFLIFAFVMYKFGVGKFLGLLDSRIEEIKTEIDTAENLRVEAQELLAQYQRKQRDAETEAAQIVANAKEHAKKISDQAKAELEESMNRRETQLKDRLARMEAQAMQDIKAHAARLAVEATKEIIATHLEKDKSLRDRLISDSVADINKRFDQAA